ncbi:hypothetical protein [Streptomyces bobili]|uniref:hypothetical protein n=1 Tax=Streptomyces bobili TaxID=67280 RepID=UPI0037A321A5
MRDGVGDFEVEDFTCEVDLGGGWVEDTEDDTTGALITAKYYPGDPTSLRRFLAGPVAALTIDCYGEDGVAQPTLAEVVDMLLQRSHFERRPAVLYRDVPAGPAVRLAGPFTQRVWGGLRRKRGYVVTYVVAPPGRHHIVELAVASADSRHSLDPAGLADALMATLRLVPVSGQDAADDPAQL